jgi:hypothetical protein
MCLILLWKTEFLEMAIADVLLQNNVVGFCW